MTVLHIDEHKFFINEYLKTNLDWLKKDLKKDYDAFLCISGREGFGKSTLAMQCAKYLDNTFSVDRVVFTAEQFKDAVEKAEKYQAIVFDETMGYLSSRGAMSKFNRALIKIMSEMRSKNLIIILCIPNFFELDRYPAMHRTTGLLHVYKRGCFMAYTWDRKLKLYKYGKKEYNYGAVKANFRGNYPKCFPIDQKAYEEKKQKAISSWEKVNSNESRWKEQRNKAIMVLYKDVGYTQEQIGQKLGISQQNIGYTLGNAPTEQIVAEL